MKSRDTLERIIGWLHMNYFKLVKVNRVIHEGRIYCVSITKPDIVTPIFMISASTSRIVIKVGVTEYVCTHNRRNWSQKLTEILG